jgi:hypothetical protein
MAALHIVTTILNLSDFGACRRRTAPLLELTHPSLKNFVFEYVTLTTMCLRNRKAGGGLQTSKNMDC